MGAVGVAPMVEGGHWRADKVGFFFPNLHYSYRRSEIVTIGKDLLYRNASAFIDHLNDLVKLCDREIVHNNIPTCLHKATLQ